MLLTIRTKQEQTVDLLKGITAKVEMSIETSVARNYDEGVNIIGSYRYVTNTSEIEEDNTIEPNYKDIKRFDQLITPEQTDNLLIGFTTEETSELAVRKEKLIYAAFNIIQSEGLMNLTKDDWEVVL